MPNNRCALTPLCGCLLQRYHEVLLLTHQKHQEWGEGVAATLDMPHQQHKILAQMAKAGKAQVGMQGLPYLFDRQLGCTGPSNS